MIPVKYRCYFQCFLLILLTCSNSASQGRVQKVTFQSASLGTEKSFNIYLPQGYDDDNNRYPVIYICRGHEDEYLKHTRILDWVEESMETGKLGKMILIFPGLTYEGNMLIGFPVNMINIESLGDPEGLGNGQFEDYFVDDLIPYVDQHFRTISNRSARGIDGFSAGAVTSSLVAFKYPELFCSVGAYDGPWGYFDFDDPSHPGPADDSIWMNLEFFDPYFGNPRNVEFMQANNPTNIVFNLTGKKLNSLKEAKFFIRPASPNAKNAFIEGSYYNRTLQLLKALRSKGIENFWVDDSLIISDTIDHDFPGAEQYFMKNIPEHYKVFSGYQ